MNCLNHLLSLCYILVNIEYCWIWDKTSYLRMSSYEQFSQFSDMLWTTKWIWKMVDRLINNGNLRFLSCGPTAFKLANKSFHFAINLAYSLNTYLNITEFCFYCWMFAWDWSLNGGHNLSTFLFTTLHPCWHLGVPTTHIGCLNSASGDKQSPVLATEAVQRSAGRKGSAAGRCECYHRWAETSR